ncbi:NnrS family protein [Nitratireductor sp. XY-223]|uniref:NnrS family protein n=1 Tax=Nitratireductor sp. XY-223 TaxID=2561926 RepID=UPI0010A9D920|nr:NnrS family protein [Nitratireductor sp. XY-223]
MATSAEKIRAWTGPAILSYGFRPFFLGGAAWAAIAMSLWLAALTGAIEIPTRLDPVSWHAHEFLYGYLGAIIAGFLLTAIPNWTGRMPIAGWQLGGLWALWLLGRIAVATSAAWPALAVSAIDLAFPLFFAGIIVREIISGRNWRNLSVVALFGILLAGNAIFHWEASRGDFAAQGIGIRIGLATAVMLIALIGGRIVPSFTRNWLAKRGSDSLPAPPMGGIDRAALLVLLAALAIWVLRPEAKAAGIGLVLAGLCHAVRLARWSGFRTGSEPLVWVLHAGYAFIPVGALVVGLSVLMPDIIGAAPAQHAWMAGGIGLMTLAVMTRATLGHTGQALTAGTATTAIYVLLIIAVFARLLVVGLPQFSGALHTASGLAWLAAFSGFVIFYGRLLILPRR